MSQPTFSVDQILKVSFPSYHRPLELARALNRTGDDAKRSMALVLLEGLRKKYPHVLAVGQELILALIESNKYDRAELVLKDLENRFGNLDEETLCRWGRLFKDRGDDYLELPVRPIEPFRAESGNGNRVLPEVTREIRRGSPDLVWLLSRHQQGDVIADRGCAQGTANRCGAWLYPGISRI